MVKWFDEQDKIIRIVLLIPFWGWLVSSLYRIFKYVEGENKNTTTLIIGVLCLLPFLPLGFIFSIIDIVTTCTADKINILAE